MCGHVIQSDKSPVMNLLHPAGFIQLHHPHILRILKIAGRIVKRQMPVLPNPQQSNIEPALWQQPRITDTLRRPILSLPANPIKSRHRNEIENMLL